MTYPPHQGGVQISHVHNLALCTEIGERLSIRMGQLPVAMPPHLVMLMKRLCDGGSEPIQKLDTPSDERFDSLSIFGRRSYESRHCTSTAELVKDCRPIDNSAAMISVVSAERLR